MRITPNRVGLRAAARFRGPHRTLLVRLVCRTFPGLQHLVPGAAENNRKAKEARRLHDGRAPGGVCCARTERGRAEAGRVPSDGQRDPESSAAAFVESVRDSLPGQPPSEDVVEGRAVQAYVWRETPFPSAEVSTRLRSAQRAWRCRRQHMTQKRAKSGRQRHAEAQHIHQGR